MNESFRVRIILNGAPYPITALRIDGLTFANETDAWPRRFAVSLVPRSDTASYRMRRVRQVNNWPFPEYRLRMDVDDGCLVFSGVKSDALPSGDYWFSLDIEDLPAVAGRYKLFIPDNGHADLPFPVTIDPRQIVIAATPVDEQIARVFAASTIDGMTAEAWLKDPTRRTNRKACLLNLMAKVRSIPFQGGVPMKPLIREVDKVFFVGTERIYVNITAGFYEDLQALARDPLRPFYLEGSPEASIHLALLAKAGVKKEQYDLVSIRQEGTTCMQAVIAVPKQHGDPYFADLDIDLGNPLQDVQGFLIHMTELINDSTTDHLALASRLAKDKNAGPFMMYTVTG